MLCLSLQGKDLTLSIENQENKEQVAQPTFTSAQPAEGKPRRRRRRYLCAAHEIRLACLPPDKLELYYRLAHKNGEYTYE